MKAQILLIEHIIFIILLLVLTIGSYYILTSIRLENTFPMIESIYTKEKLLDVNIANYSIVYTNYPLTSFLYSRYSRVIKELNNITIYTQNT